MASSPPQSPLRHLAIAVLGLVGLVALVAVDRLWLSKRPSDGAKPAVSDTERHYAEQRADLCGGGNAIGVGLKGDYFSEPAWSGNPILSRTDKVVDFDSGFEMPAGPQGAARPRSIRWSGWIKPPLNGRYRFHFDVPGAVVTVARQEVVGASAKPDSAVEMAIGRFYPITVEVRQVDDVHTGRWRLEWTAPHGLRYVVPTALLFLPANTTPAPAAPADTGKADLR